ncbi:AMP-dependent synthetase/ligase [Tuberibacillus calidus]|uniref:AMP-dependent synthetase/ligase n=1 Tax=Tuberibacillus calidus TaxID=340097 RepID=UPI0003FA7AB8|nr:long-chain fatty acid--CoA ligase [Tuberibacillus calidus]
MKPQSLIEMLSLTVNQYPDKAALMWKRDGSYRSMTYRQLWDRIHRFASGLSQLGIGRDSKVAILSENNPMWAITDFAVASLGAVSVPIYPTLPAEQVHFILDNADVEVAVVENEEQLRKIADGNTDVRYGIIMNPPSDWVATDKWRTFSEVEEDGEHALLRDWEDGWRKIERDDLATIIHTSGTTGPPKGVMLTHGNFLSNMEGVHFWVIELFPSDVALSYLPLSHVFERMAGHFMPLSSGCTIAYAESIDKIPENFLEVRPTIMTSVPRLFEKVYAKVLEEVESGSSIKKKIFNWAVDVGRKRYELYLKTPINELLLRDPMPKNLKRKWALADKLVFQKVKAQLGGRLRGMVSGGGTLNPEIASFFWALDIPILEGYGLTETSPVVTTNPMIRAKVGTIGRPLPNLEVKIAEDGEILVKGPNVMKGYYKDKEATEKDLVDGWFHTGDIGEFDEEGYLKIIDRKKHLLVLSTGKNVAPAPIENAINESRFIENSVLVGDKRKFVSVLIKPDYENLIPWAEKQGIPTDSRKALLHHSEVVNLLHGEVARLTRHFANFEQPKKVVIIEDDWTVESGELTPKLSIRMNAIQEKYGALIDDLYANAEKPEAETAAGLRE